MSGISITLSPEGLKQAEKLYKEVTPELSLFDTQQRMKEATLKAYDLIVAIKKQREQEKTKIFNFNPASAVSLRQLNALLDADPCWIDLDARRSYENIAGQNNLLHLAAEKGLCDVAEKLLDKGAPIDSVSERGTPLCCAINQMNDPMVDLLLARGASANYVFPNKIERDHFGIRSDRNYSPIIQAADCAGGAQTILKLYQHGADVNVKIGDFDERAIDKTRWAGLLPEVKMLLACGANPNLPSRGNRTVLYEALDSHSTTEYVDALLDAGANVRLPLGSDNTFQIAMGRKRKSDTESSLYERCKRVTDRHAAAKACWGELEQAWNQSPEQAVRKVSARDLIYCSNIGKLDTLLELRGWSRARDHLQQLLPKLPTWMVEHVAQRHPALIHPTTPGTDWCTRIADKSQSESRGRAK